jgi:hypothetical protein
MKNLLLLKKWRYLILAAVLIATWMFISTSATQSSDTPIVEAAAPKQRLAANGDATVDRIDTLQLERLKRSRANADKVNLFPSKSWYVAPPPPPPPPPPVPTAPALPFTYLGKQLDANGKFTYYLSQGDRLRIVSLGEILDSTYSIDSVDHGQMELTYLPLKIKQYLSIGETP